MYCVQSTLCHVLLCTQPYTLFAVPSVLCFLSSHSCCAVLSCSLCTVVCRGLGLSLLPHCVPCLHCVLFCATFNACTVLPCYLCLLCVVFTVTLRSLFAGCLGCHSAALCALFTVHRVHCVFTLCTASCSCRVLFTVCTTFTAFSLCALRPVLAWCSSLCAPRSLRFHSVHFVLFLQGAGGVIPAARHPRSPGTRPCCRHGRVAVLCAQRFKCDAGL